MKRYNSKYFAYENQPACGSDGIDAYRCILL